MPPAAHSPQVPRRLHAAAHGTSAQFYAGPAGAGAPFHHHEHAVNALGSGRKTWFLRPPAEALAITSKSQQSRCRPASPFSCLKYICRALKHGVFHLCTRQREGARQRVELAALPRVQQREQHEVAARRVRSEGRALRHARDCP